MLYISVITCLDFVIIYKNSNIPVVILKIYDHVGKQFFKNVVNNEIISNSAQICKMLVSDIFVNL